jgi:cyclopropane-fatty-acyl-phospholipid synthase
VRRGLSVLAPRQTPGRAHKNIAHHYDLDEAFYRLFLDDDLQYTCAYFERPDVTLEQAQLAKKRHIASKLALEEDQRVLDIGSGWGGLCLYLAEAAGVRAHGVTLSEAQYRVAQRRVEERGLADRVSFELCDYRRVQGAFDRIVSVGMFEAIGKKEIENFFVTAARLLEKRGVVLLHSIGRTRKRAVQNPWLEKYIFPGSYIPALSEVLPSVERAGFIVTDLEILRLHYAYTLREWRRRFVANQQRVIEIYDARFFRMWEFYLAASEAGFRIDRMFIFQLQLARHQDAVPLTRSYMAEAEQELSKREDRLYGR